MSKFRGRGLYIGQLWIENKMQKTTLCTVVSCFWSMLVASEFRGCGLCMRQLWIKNKVQRMPVADLFSSDEVRLLVVGMTADTPICSNGFGNKNQTFWMSLHWVITAVADLNQCVDCWKHMPISKLWPTACDHEQEKISSLLAQKKWLKKHKDEQVKSLTQQSLFWQ